MNPKIVLLTLLLLSNTGVFATDDASVTWQAVTNSGQQLSIYSQLSPLVINTIHSWEIQLKDAEGALIPNAAIEVIGGMPEHDHGLPTQPQITQTLENGAYLLEGVRFHMPGKWQITITILSAGEESQAVIEFDL